MSVIYILQKEVAGLGQLTKIGMTTRDGEDRAAEYGGGGWEVVESIEVSVSDVYELRDIESRIHARLENYRSHSAKGLGLVEVFTCTADEAVAVAQAEIGTRATDTSRVEMLRKRTNQAVERKILQSHASDLAKLHLGRYPPPDILRLRNHGLPDGASRDDAALWHIHSTALAALDRIGADASTFRAMVSADLTSLQLRCAAEELKRTAAEKVRREQQELEQRKLQVQERARREEFHQRQEQENARTEALRREQQEKLEQDKAAKYALAEKQMRDKHDLRVRLADFNRQQEGHARRMRIWKRVVVSCATLAIFLGLLAGTLWHEAQAVHLVSTIALTAMFASAAVYGAFEYRRENERKRTKRRNWDDAYSSD